MAHAAFAMLYLRLKIRIVNTFAMRHCSQTSFQSVTTEGTHVTRFNGVKNAKTSYLKWHLRTFRLNTHRDQSRMFRGPATSPSKLGRVNALRPALQCAKLQSQRYSHHTKEDHHDQARKHATASFQVSANHNVVLHASLPRTEILADAFTGKKSH
jgi:hypothetical protein